MRSINSLRRNAGIAFGVMLLASCQSLDQTLDTADKAISIVQDPTTQTIAGIATASDPNAALRAALKARAQLYESDPHQLVADIRTVKADYDKLVQALTGNVNKTWGKQETKLPTQTNYVKYTQNYQSRAIVDFDAGTVTVETVDDQAPKTSLKNAIVTTLLTPDDPRAVDLFTDQGITLTSDKKPYLLGLVVDQKNKSIATPTQAESYADYLIQNKSATRQVTLQDGTKNALYVEFALVANFENKQADKYKDLVAKLAAQYNVSPSLIFGVIRTESNFNPFAVSSVPAYGMMQLVPASGGREAYKIVTGNDEMPTKEYLFDANNNIELGAAYLGNLGSKQLDVVTNQVSREYCVISAYNTGPSNVLKAFNKDKVAAVNSINSMEPPAVYDQLVKNLPYAETRQYLQTVVGYRKQFLSFGNSLSEQ